MGRPSSQIPDINNTKNNSSFQIRLYSMFDLLILIILNSQVLSNGNLEISVKIFLKKKIN